MSQNDVSEVVQHPGGQTARVAQEMVGLYKELFGRGPTVARAIEEITGRRVRALVSGMDTVQDVSCEVFYLEPNGPPV